MLDLLHFLDFLYSPSEWSKMNGPMAAVTAFLCVMFGLLCLALGLGLSWLDGPLTTRATGVLICGLGLALLVSVGTGLRAFFRT